MARLVPNTSFIAAILLTSFVAVGTDFVSAKPSRGLYGPSLGKEQDVPPGPCGALSIGRRAETSGRDPAKGGPKDKGRALIGPG